MVGAGILLRRSRHAGGGTAENLGRHGFQLSADQHRRYRVDDRSESRKPIRALVHSKRLFDDIEVRQGRRYAGRSSVQGKTVDRELSAIEGNKDIKTEDLMESLRGVGLAKGRTFDQSVLDEVSGFLREQYYDRGKYGVSVDTSVIDSANNTVRVGIVVKEGDRAKIRQVNLVGNSAFEEEEIREGFELDTANWLSWMRQDDRYSKERWKVILRNCGRFI